MKNEFEDDGIKDIKTPKLVEGEDEDIIISRRRTTKRVEDIPMDDVLIDSELDENQNENEEKINGGQNPPASDEALIMSEDDITNDDSENDEKNIEQPANIIPPTDITLPQESKYKKKRLRKSLGLDDDLTVINGSHATTAKSEKKKRKSYVSEETRHARIKNCIFAGLTICAVYGGIFAVVNVLNKEYYTTISQKLTAAAISKDPIIAEDVYYLDSDKDGLSDEFEKNIFKTDPQNPDSDSDGLNDGAEYAAKTNPLNAMSDGTTKDSQRTGDTTLAEETATLKISTRIDLAANCTINEYKSLIKQYPGVVSKMYEINGVSGSSTLGIKVTDADLAVWKSNKNNLALYKINTETLKSEEVPSEYKDGEVTAEIKSDGVYFAADKTLFNMDSGIDVMFLIDNSGSMYSASVVDNSEENDLDFKRVALSESLIKALDSKTCFGVAKFTAKYTLLNAVSDKSADSVASLESIKNGSESFDGTEISKSIMSAAEAFSDNSRRRYIIMITDGLPSVKNDANEKKAIQCCIDNHISVIAISLGKKTDTEFLTEIADQTDGAFYQAINTASFDSIGDKIKNYMYIKHETVDTGDGTVTLAPIADTGFSEKDCLSIGGVPTTLSIIGSPVGSAVINKLYYTGKIPLSQHGNESTKSYNLVDSEFFIDGKGNLSTYEISSIVNYNYYLGLSNKWDFKSASTMLPFTEETKNWLAEHSFKTVMADYNGKLDETGTLAIMRTITFQKLTQFNTYEKAIIDVETLEIPERQIYYAASYYDDINQSNTYSFGLDGDKAFELLSSELGSGVPSVLISEDNTIYNAVKISRNVDKPNEFIVTVKDVKSPANNATLYLNRQTVTTSSGEKTQFVVKTNGKEQKLYILDTSSYK